MSDLNRGVEMLGDLDLLLSEDWLKTVGFKWHEFERQGGKHWLLWLGDVVRDGNGFSCTEDLGVEVASGRDLSWFCWLRADYAGRYSRFLHLRSLRTRRDLAEVIVGVTGVEFDPSCCWYGSLLTPERAEAARRDAERLDRRMLREGSAWRNVEKDDTRGGALPEHMEEAVKVGRAK